MYAGFAERASFVSSASYVPSVLPAAGSRRRRASRPSAKTPW